MNVGLAKKVSEIITGLIKPCSKGTTNRIKKIVLTGILNT